MTNQIKFTCIPVQRKCDHVIGWMIIHKLVHFYLNIGVIHIVQYSRLLTWIYTYHRCKLADQRSKWSCRRSIHSKPKLLLLAMPGYMSSCQLTAFVGFSIFSFWSHETIAMAVDRSVFGVTRWHSNNSSSIQFGGTDVGRDVIQVSSSANRGTVRVRCNLFLSKKIPFKWRTRR